MKTRYAGGLSYLLVVICLLLLRVSMYTGIASGVSDTDLYFTLVCQLLCFGSLLMTAEPSQELRQGNAG